MSYKVNIPEFEGPFDLLVYLIENAKMNIYDIQISEITGQYIEYVKNMKDLDLNTSGEFMVLAATLLDIKSRMILPRVTYDGETLIEEDPRSQLVERLLEYKKYKKGAEIFRERQELYSNALEKPQEDISEYLDNPDEVLKLDLKHFSDAFLLFLSKKKREEDVRKHYTKIEREKATVENRMLYIKNIFKGREKELAGGLNLKELIPDKKSPYDIVVTFVSVLQMVRDKFLDAKQEKTYGDINVIPGERGMGENTYEQ